jgi:hypothetical protein
LVQPRVAQPSLHVLAEEEVAEQKLVLGDSLGVVAVVVDGGGGCGRGGGEWCFVV